MTLNFEANKHTNDIRFQRNDQIAMGIFQTNSRVKTYYCRTKKV